MGNCYISRRVSNPETNNYGNENGNNLVGAITLSGDFAETIIGEITSLEEQNNE